MVFIDTVQPVDIRFHLELVTLVTAVAYLVVPGEKPAGLDARLGWLPRYRSSSRTVYCAFSGIQQVNRQ